MPKDKRGPKSSETKVDTDAVVKSFNDRIGKITGAQKNLAAGMTRAMGKTISGTSRASAKAIDSLTDAWAEAITSGLNAVGEGTQELVTAGGRAFADFRDAVKDASDALQEKKPEKQKAHK